MDLIKEKIASILYENLALAYEAGGDTALNEAINSLTENQATLVYEVVRAKAVKQPNAVDQAKSYLTPDNINKGINKTKDFLMGRDGESTASQAAGLAADFTPLGIPRALGTYYDKKVTGLKKPEEGLFGHPEADLATDVVTSLTGPILKGAKKGVGAVKGLFKEDGVMPNTPQRRLPPGQKPPSFANYMGRQFKTAYNTVKGISASDVGNFLVGKDKPTGAGMMTGLAADFTPLGIPRAIGRYSRGEQSGQDTAVDLGLAAAGPLAKGAKYLYKGAKNLLTKGDDVARAAKMKAPNVNTTPAGTGPAKNINTPTTTSAIHSSRPNTAALPKPTGTNLAPRSTIPSSGAKPPMSGGKIVGLSGKGKIGLGLTALGLGYGAYKAFSGNGEQQVPGIGVPNQLPGHTPNMPKPEPKPTPAPTQTTPPATNTPPATPPPANTGSTSAPPPASNTPARSSMQEPPQRRRFGYGGTATGTAGAGLNAGQITNRALGGVFEEKKNNTMKRIKQIMDSK